MRETLIAAALAALLAAGAASADGTGASGTDAAETEAAQPSDAAMAFAGEFSDDHLSAMLSRVGGRSHAMRTLSRLHGQLVATVFDGQIDAAVARHGDAWQRNLALAWAPLLSEAELASLAEQGADSPYAEKYAANRDAAGAAMQRMSEGLFKRILQEVVANTVRVLGAEPSDTGADRAPAD